MLDKAFLMSFLIDALQYEGQRDAYEVDAYWMIHQACSELLLKHFGIHAQQKSIRVLMEELQNAR